MKRCPECRRDYYDDTLLYCLDDGNALLEGPASDSGSTNERSTAIMSGGSGDQLTRVLRPPAVADRYNGNSIAVLPFANMSADVENEYFCDGLAEELLNALAKVENLRVAARTSAFSFKGKNTNVGEIGRILSVKTVLEGSVRKSGDRVRITVQLINADDGYHLWSERYDREMHDIFAVQDEITLAVVDALKVRLLGGEKAAVMKRHTDNTEAYELYLRGRYFWNRRKVDDFQKAIDQFEKAIELDPDYALAHSGLADCYSFLGYFEGLSPDAAKPKASVGVAKALELGPDIAEVQASMAMYKLFYEFDWKAGEQHLLESIRLNPKLPQGHYWYCSLLGAQGRFDEADQQGRIALELDPLAPIVSGNVSRGLCHARRFDEAIALALRSLEVDPDFFFTHWVLGVAYSQTDRMNDAIPHFRIAAERSGFLALKANLAFALALAGETDEARQILGEFFEDAKTRYVSPLCMSVVYVGLGETENALEWLERAWEIRAIQLMWLKTEPVFDPLRAEPRFQKVCDEIGLPT
ncbi:MAG TPA: tetratricopeptide repeat protein [Pyrinomonadaceae bacterium]|nr:tetratricopeptide repeat protein [Pyrinomonadaceae bacterium]